VKREGCTKAKVSVPDFDEFKAQFVNDVKAKLYSLQRSRII